MGAVKVDAFLTAIAVERRMTESTHNQAKSALLFLCTELLEAISLSASGRDRASFRVR